MKCENRFECVNFVLFDCRGNHCNDDYCAEDYDFDDVDFIG